MEGNMCRICEHQAHHHSESGCQLTTCSCIKFEENILINPEEKIEIQKRRLYTMLFTFIQLTLIQYYRDLWHLFYCVIIE